VPGGKKTLPVVALLGSFWTGETASTVPKLTCGDVKNMYKQEKCCNAPSNEVPFSITSFPSRGSKLFGGLASDNKAHNPCHATKPTVSGFDNTACRNSDDEVVVKEQAGANVTAGYQGTLNIEDNGVKREPIQDAYYLHSMCPVNVHWHLGAEHLSVGQFDDVGGTGPDNELDEDEDGEIDSRRLAAVARRGHRCKHYDETDSRFTTPYTWQHCVSMHVGETYEVHWPHSKSGMCGTPWQYQTPFYDGVFCRGTDFFTPSLQEAVGVQGQVFTIINDESYYYPDLMRGMIVQGNFGTDVAKYTGSTTGTSRNNTICSAYTPITWQVDRKCHLISASSFDKMCADMKNQLDDMSSDLHAHGARETVETAYVGNNFHRV